MNKSQSKNGNGSNRRNGPKKQQQQQQNSNRSSNQRGRNNSTSGKSPSGTTFAPSTQSKKMTTGVPRIENRSDGSVIIRHKEFLHDIIGSIDFRAGDGRNVQGALPINAGRHVTFPWLSGMARNYENFLFNRLEFSFVTSSPSSAGGRVMIGIDYDSYDQPPLEKGEIMAWANSTSCSTWQFCEHKSLLSNLHKEKIYFVRTNLDIPGDRRLSDVGLLYIATAGQASDTAIIGELYVEYEVKLMTPNLNDAALGAAVSQVRTGTANSAPFGTLARGLTDLLTLVSSGTTTSVSTFTFNQAWEGVISFSCQGTGIDVLGFTDTGTSTHGVSASLVSTAQTAFVTIIRVKAIAGQTLILTLVNTTLSGATGWFMNGDSYA